MLDSIRSVQESIERIAKQTGTEHLFGDMSYLSGLGKEENNENEKPIIGKIFVGNILYTQIGIQTTNGASSFEKDVFLMLNTIAKTKLGKTRINQILKSQSFLSIQNIVNDKRKSYADSSAFDLSNGLKGEDSGNIVCNTKLAFVYEGDKAISATTMLAHEIDHAWLGMSLTEDYIKTSISSPAREAFFGNMGLENGLDEEMRATIGLERDIAIYLKQHTRKTYSEKVIRKYFTTNPNGIIEDETFFDRLPDDVKFQIQEYNDKN